MQNYKDPPVLDHRLIEAVRQEGERKLHLQKCDNEIYSFKQQKLDKLRAMWLHNLEESNLRKMIKFHTNTVDLELVQANKATVLVRRAALHYKLKNEHNQYVEELAAQGKAFYAKR